MLNVPSSRMRVTMTASSVGTKPRSSSEPFVSGTPATCTLSLMAIVLPSSLPRELPLMLVR